MVTVHIAVLPLMVAVFGMVANAIMVPTGKIGGIMPAKPMAVAPRLAPAQYRAPAAVWERIDEGDNPYQPPVYKYVLWDYVQKYGHHTLIARDEDYYHQAQQLRAQPVTHYFYKSKTPEYFGKESYSSYSKNKFYYSPLQQL